MKHILSIILLLLITTNLSAQEVSTTTFSDTVNALMEDYHIPGAAVAIIEGGEVVFAEGFGVTDTQTGEPVTADTVFPIGSISKSFTALAALQLVEQGLLDLDAPISTYVSDLTLAEDDAADQITLRMLLTHTAGFGDIVLPTLEQYEDRDAVIADFERVPIAFEPGTTRSYSNYGYILAGYIIETVAGQSWENYVRANIFEPLGMVNSSFGSNLLGEPSYAAPHTFDLIEGSISIPFYEDIDLSGPAGSINATINDMASYLLMHMGNNTDTNQAVVSDEGLAQLHLLSGEGFAYGWFALQKLGLNRFVDIAFLGHNGAFEGYNAFAAFDVETQTGAIVLTNMDINTGEQFTQAVLVEALAVALDMPLASPFIETLEDRTGFGGAQLTEWSTQARNYAGTPPSVILGEYESPLLQQIIIRIEDEAYVIDLPAIGVEGLPMVFLDNDTFTLNIPTSGFGLYRFEIDGEDSVRILQGTTVIAFRGEASLEAVFENPDAGFRVAVSDGLAVTALADITLYIVEDPSGTLGIVARVAGDDLLTDVLDVLTTVTPGFAGEPIAVNSLPETNGRIWEQYVFAHEDQIYVVNTTRIDDVNVFLMAVATEANIEPVFLMMNDMTVSFTTTD